MRRSSQAEAACKRTFYLDLPLTDLAPRVRAACQSLGLRLESASAAGTDWVLTRPAHLLSWGERVDINASTRGTGCIVTVSVRRVVEGNPAARLAERRLCGVISRRLARA